MRRKAKEIAALLKENEYAHILPNIRQLRARSEKRDEVRQLELPLAA